MQLKERASKWIEEHKDEMIADIGKIVSIKSVSVSDDSGYPHGAGCAQVLDEFLKMCNNYGFVTDNCDYHCGSATMNCSSPDARQIGLWGHLDVVDEGSGWTYEPYNCVHSGDFLIGRGTNDNKGPAVAALYAMRCLKELGVELKNNVRLVAGCNEEAGMDDIPHYLNKHKAPDLSLVPDCEFPVCCGEKGLLEALVKISLPADSAILDLTGGVASNVVPETARLALKTGSISQEMLKKLSPLITVEERTKAIVLVGKGKAGHVAMPDGSLNAFEVLCSAVSEANLLSGRDHEIISYIAKVCSDGYGKGLGIDCEDDFYGPLTSTGSLIATSDSCLTITFNIRYPAAVPHTDILDKIAASALTVQGTSSQHRHSGAHFFDKSSPVVETLMDIVRDVTKMDAQPYAMGGGTYARMLPNALGFGPGQPTDFSPLGFTDGRGSCHGPDEAVSIPNLCQGVLVYVLSIAHLDEKNLI